MLVAPMDNYTCCITFQLCFICVYNFMLFELMLTIALASMSSMFTLLLC